MATSCRRAAKALSAGHKVLLGTDGDVSRQVSLLCHKAPSAVPSNWQQPCHIALGTGSRRSHAHMSLGKMSTPALIR